MPLLNGKPWFPAKPGERDGGKNATKDNEATGSDTVVHRIAFTGETFGSKTEYQKMLSFYKKPMWSCSCSGQSGLTYEDAQKSERNIRSNVRENFPAVFFKPVLEHVHHRSESLDAVVDAIHKMISARLFVDEKVQLQSDSSLRGVVVKVQASGGSDAASSDAKFMYSVKLTEKEADGTPRVLSGIPHHNINRLTNLPSKSLLKKFVRCFASKTTMSNNMPWIVDDDLRRRYSIKDKLASIFVQPSKVIQPPVPRNKELGRLLNKIGTPKAGTKADEKPKNTTVLDNITDRTSLVRVESADGTVKEQLIVKTPVSSKGGALSSIDNVARKRKTGDEHASSDDEPLGTKPEAKKLKQSTLAAVSKDKKELQKEMKAQEERNAKRFIKNLMAHKDELKSKAYNGVAMLAMKVLKESDLAKIPDEAVRADMKGRIERFQQRIMLSKMTDEEKKQYHEKRRLEARKEAEEKRARDRMRFEDRELTDSASLPEADDVVVPAGFDMTLFADVCMVAEFFSCFVELFVEDEKKLASSVSLNSVLRSVTPGLTVKEGDDYINKLIQALLSVLLQDDGILAENISEMHTKLTDIPMNEFTAAEIARLCLRGKTEEEHNARAASRNSSKSGSAGPDAEDADTSFHVTEQVVGLDLLGDLESHDLTELQPRSKLQLLVGLIHRLLISGDSVIDMQEQLHVKSNELHKERMKKIHERNQEKQAEKEKEKAEKKEKGKKEEGVAGTKAGEAAEDVQVLGDSADEEEGSDMASVVKRRRQMATLEKQKKESEQREKEERRRKEAAEYDKQYKLEQLERKCEEMRFAAARATHMQPLGTDRHHARYWIFGSASGVFVEQGWITEDVDYGCDMPEEFDVDGELLIDLETGNPVEKDGQKRITAMVEQTPETTHPQPQESTWRVYDTIEQIDSLLASLNGRGYRESLLKQQLQYYYAYISHCIKKSKKDREVKDASETSETETEEAEAEEGTQKGSLLDSVFEGLRSELLELEVRLREGGLGGVSDFDVWRVAVNSANKLDDLRHLIIECQEGIHPKFRTGCMSASGVQKHVQSGETADDAATRNIEHWSQMVKSCATVTRMHCIVGILETCVKWEKSVADARCKICRKQGNDDHLLLCDTCNCAYHMFCLRPRLQEVPEGEWFCVACKPLSPRKATRRRVQVEDSESEEESEEEEEEEIQHEDCCAVCGEVESEIYPFAACNKCPSVYHKDCHEPPLRTIPRANTFTCQTCQGGGKRRVKRSGGGSRPPARGAARKNINVDFDLQDSDLFDAENSASSHYDEDPSSQSDSGSGSSEDEAPRGRRQVKRSSQTERKRATRAASPEPSDVTDYCVQLFEELSQLGRIATSLAQLDPPSRGGARRAAPPRPHDLNSLRANLKRYETVDDFFDDLNHVIKYAKGVFKQQPRKLEQILDVETTVAAMISRTSSME